MAWYKESGRHSKAARGIKTGKKDRSNFELNFRRRKSVIYRGHMFVRDKDTGKRRYIPIYSDETGSVGILSYGGRFKTLDEANLIVRS